MRWVSRKSRRERRQAALDIIELDAKKEKGLIKKSTEETVRDIMNIIDKAVKDKEDRVSRKTHRS